MTVLRVSLFGSLCVSRDDEALTTHCPRKVQELLSYLLLYRDRSHPREALAGLLWGDSSTAQSKKNLRQALWQLQAVTRSEADLAGKCLLLVDCDRVRLNPDADLRLDVAVFERAFVRTQGIHGADLDAEHAQALRCAADLYRGDLLESWFHDWCLYERERLRNHYLVILDKLVDRCEARGEHETGLAYGVQSLRYDGARERTHRRLMRLYYLTGDRTSALRQYDRCVEALRRELAVAPATRTVALYEQIRAGQYSGPGQRSLATLDAQSPGAPQMSQALKHLRQIQRSLTETQIQLRQVVRAVELAMKE